MPASTRAQGWRALPARFAFPLRGDTPALIGACALARLLSYALGASLSVQWLPTLSVAGSSSSVFAVVLGLLIDLGILMVGLKLAVEALLDTAHDRVEPGKAGGLLVTDGQALGQIALLLIFLVPVYLIALLAGVTAATCALLLVAVVLPAAIMLQAMDENLWHALDPRAWLALFGRTGRRLPGHGRAAGDAGRAALRPALPDLVAAAGLARRDRQHDRRAVCAGGRLSPARPPDLRASRQRLGLDLTPPIVRPSLGNAEEDETMRAADRLFAEEGPAPAADCLRALIERRGASAPIHDRYRQLLLASNDLPRLAEHAQQQVAALFALGQPRRALALVLESRTRDPAFRLENPETIATVVTHAAESGHSQLAVELARDFDTRFPKSPDRPRTLLTAARLLAERFGRDEEARRLLEGLEQRYPDHPLAEEFAKALATLPVARAAPPGLRCANLRPRCHQPRDA